MRVKAVLATVILAFAGWALPAAASPRSSAVLSLPLPHGAIGAGLFGGRTGNVYLGNAIYPDNTIHPALWIRTGFSRFTAIDLGLPPGMTYGGAYAADARGDIVVTYDDGCCHFGAYVLSQGRRHYLKPLATSPDSGVEAFAVDAHGVVYGDSDDGPGVSPVRWTDWDAQPQPLDVPAGYGGFAHAVTPAGRSAGGLTNDGEHLQAARWGRAGTHAQLLPFVGTGNRSFVYGISRRGEVAGRSNLVPDGDPHAVVWRSNGHAVDAGTLPGDADSTFFGLSLDGRAAVGNSYSGDGAGRAIYWTGHGPLETLPPYGDPASGSNALHVDTNGEVEGWTVPVSGAVVEIPTLWVGAAHLAYVPGIAAVRRTGHAVPRPIVDPTVSLLRR